MKIYNIAILISFMAFLSGCWEFSDKNKSISKPIIDADDLELERKLIDAALISGNLDGISDKGILNYLNDEIETLRSRQKSVGEQIFPNGVVYNKDRNARSFFIHDNRVTWPLITGEKGLHLGVIGENQGYRYAAFSTELTKPSNDVMDYSALKNTVNWLMNNGDLEKQKFSVRYVALRNNSSDTHLWFENYYPNSEVQRCKETDEESVFSACLEGADLIVSGWQLDDVKQTPLVFSVLKKHIDNKKPLLYMHAGYGWFNVEELSPQLLETMAVETDNLALYYKNDSASWSSYQEMMDSDIGYWRDELKLVRHFIEQDFHFDFSVCNGADCREDLPELASRFINGAEKIKEKLNQYDNQGVELFSTNNHKQLKLFILLGDYYRKSIRYPMEKTTTDQMMFLSAYLADHLVFYTRTHNLAQIDLGNFSPPIEDTIPLSTHIISKNLGDHEGSRMTGLYVLPGQTVTIKRLDNLSDLPVYVSINTQRPGSSRLFNEIDPNNRRRNGYTRPKYLKSPSLPVYNDRNIMISSPYGGPLIIELPKKTQLDQSQQVTIEVGNVTKHPMLTNLNDVEEFKAEVEASPLNWSGIATSYLEANNHKEIIKGFADTDYHQGDWHLAFDDIWHYLFKGAYELIGRSGNYFDSGSNEVLELAPEVKSRCLIYGWDCQHSDVNPQLKIQRFNVDIQAACGSACSGNPIDATAPLNGLGAGYTHELGHNLWRGRLGIYGLQSFEVQNMIFNAYLDWNYYQDHQIKLSKTFCEPTRWKNAKSWIEEAQETTNPKEYVKKKLWDPTGTYTNNHERLAFYLQIPVLTEKLNLASDLRNGWQVFTLMFLHERLFNSISNDDWALMKHKIGMSSYLEKPSINGNDFYLITSSFLLKTDMRPMFDLWGVNYSEDASSQVDIYSYPKISKEFHDLGTNFCENIYL